MTSGSQLGDTVSVPPTAATSLTSLTVRIVLPPPSGPGGAIDLSAVIASSAPGRFSGTSNKRKPAANKISPTDTARAGSSPRKIATSGGSIAVSAGIDIS